MDWTPYPDELGYRGISASGDMFHLQWMGDAGGNNHDIRLRMSEDIARTLATDFERELGVVEWANEDIDRLQHTGYTCDMQGDRTSAKDDGREAVLRELLDRLDAPYEHDPETCEGCQIIEEMDL